MSLPLPIEPWICLDCASVSPKVPTASCRHRTTAVVATLRPSAVDIITNVRRLQRSLSAALDTLREHIELEAEAGRAQIAESLPSTTGKVVQLRARPNVQFVASPVAPLPAELAVAPPPAELARTCYQLHYPLFPSEADPIGFDGAENVLAVLRRK